MVKLKLVGDTGETYLVVTVCAFSRWVEAGPIVRKDSRTLMHWFHSQIVCRFGVPYAVRCDRGTEFGGQFADYL